MPDGMSGQEGCEDGGAFVLCSTAAAPSRPPPQAGEENLPRRYIPPPACGRGWGRDGAPGRAGCSATAALLSAAARPLAPSRPPPQAGEEKICGGDGFPSTPLPLAAAPSIPPPVCGRGRGRAAAPGRAGCSAAAAPLSAAARPPAPSRPPPQAGEEKICGGGGFPSSPLPLAAAPLIPPPACGLPHAHISHLICIGVWVCALGVVLIPCVDGV